MFHIHELYNKLEFKEENSLKENSKIKYYILISKQILEKIKTLFFPYQKDFFSFSNKIKIEEEPYFIDGCLDELTKRIQKLENNNISKDIIEIIKALILDINIFIIILKKNPSFKVNEINLINVLYKNEINTRNKFIQTLKEYLHNIKNIENSFNDGFKYEFYSKPVQCILPIQEKNIILFLLHNSRNYNDFEFRLYDINNIVDNNYLCLRNFNVSFMGNKKICEYRIKLYNIDSKIILIDYAYTCYGYYHDFESFIFFLEIEYDKKNKPINIKLLSEEKFKDINIIINDYYIDDLDCFNKDSIIIFPHDIGSAFYIFKKVEENYFYLVKKMSIEKDNNAIKKFKKFNNFNNREYHKNKVLVDKYNNQIIIYYYTYKFVSRYSKIYSIGINFYDYDLNLKKVINYEENLDSSTYSDFFLNILNKECYILSIDGKVLLISAKYLEIITIYNLHINIGSIFVLSNSNRILILNDSLNFLKRNHDYNENRIMSIYKLDKKELKYVGKKEYINKEIFDIKEINEKGDQILVTNSLLYFNFKGGVKKISKLYYIKNINNERNKNIKKDYSMLKNKKKNYSNNNFLYDDEDDYFDCIYDYEHNCNFEDCWCWYSYWNNFYNKYGYNYIYKKEDKHFIKKRYKNKGKRKYINFRNFKMKKKYEKYRNNKVNLNRYENEEFYEDTEENNYYNDKNEDEDEDENNCFY